MYTATMCDRISNRKTITQLIQCISEGCFNPVWAAGYSLLLLPTDRNRHGLITWSLFILFHQITTLSKFSVLSFTFFIVYIFVFCSYLGSYLTMFRESRSLPFFIAFWFWLFSHIKENDSISWRLFKLVTSLLAQCHHATI